MYTCGLDVVYHDGIDMVLKEKKTYPVGELLCKIFQGEYLRDISQRLANCIHAYPAQDADMTQDNIEAAEKYVLTALSYTEFYPAERLAQGSMIRQMEHYRALDSYTKGRLLQEELDRANKCSLDINIGFGSIGQFLRLCLNNYMVDLVEARRVFSTMAAIYSDSAFAEEIEQFEEVCIDLDKNSALIPGIEMHLVYKAEEIQYECFYTINSFLSFVVFELSHIAQSPVWIRRCQNPACGKFFVAKRIDARYCKFPAPQNEETPCNKYYPQYIKRQKIRNSAVERAEKNALSRLGMYKKRHPDLEHEINKLKRVIQTSDMKTRTLKGELTVGQYKDWLNTHKCKKEEEECNE